jgi:talin
MLINAVKDVASALGDLIQATKAASGKSINDPSMNHLKDSAKVCCCMNISAWKW